MEWGLFSSVFRSPRDLARWNELYNCSRSQSWNLMISCIGTLTVEEKNKLKSSGYTYIAHPNAPGQFLVWLSAQCAERNISFQPELTTALFHKFSIHNSSTSSGLWIAFHSRTLRTSSRNSQRSTPFQQRSHVMSPASAWIAVEKYRVIVPFATSAGAYLKIPGKWWIKTSFYVPKYTPQIWKVWAWSTM